jgi:hypothetical protein
MKVSSSAVCCNKHRRIIFFQMLLIGLASHHVNAWIFCDVATHKTTFCHVKIDAESQRSISTVLIQLAPSFLWIVYASSILSQAEGPSPSSACSGQKKSHPFCKWSGRILPCMSNLKAEETKKYLQSVQNKGFSPYPKASA